MEKGCFETEFGPFNPITACPWRSQRTSLSTYLSLSLSLSRSPLFFSAVSWLLLSSCLPSSFLSVSSPLSYVRALFLSLFFSPSLPPRRFLSSSLARSRSVSHGAHACMHACMHFEAREDGSTLWFRPGSRLSFSSRRREPQLVKKLPDRLGARRADSAVVYDPTPNTLSSTSSPRPSIPLAHPAYTYTRTYTDAP